jgi:phosphoglycerate dehydrogenase-like enzyme
MTDKTIVASQLPSEVGSLFALEVPNAEFRTIPAGAINSLPPEAAVLLTVPAPGEKSLVNAPRPAGWPFGVRWVHLASAGLDQFPPWLFDGPIVTSSPGESAVALAEYSLAAIFVAAKRLPELWIESASQWRYIPVTSVAGTALGIVGFGAIGEALAPRAQALGMNVTALRRSDRPMTAGVERATGLEALFASSDHVVVAAPATVETGGMINRAVLQQAKMGLHLINIARGRLIDDAALLEALGSGRVSRATLDCTDPEPLPAEHPFYRHPKVRLSPHTAAMSADLSIRLARVFAENLRCFRSRAALRNRVDYSRGY